MAKINVTGYDKKGTRKVFVNGIDIPDVESVKHEVAAGGIDVAVITIRADSYESKLYGGDQVDEVQEAK